MSRREIREALGVPDSTVRRWLSEPWSSSTSGERWRQGRRREDDPLSARRARGEGRADPGAADAGRASGEAMNTPKPPENPPPATTRQIAVAGFRPKPANHLPPSRHLATETSRAVSRAPGREAPPPLRGPREGPLCGEGRPRRTARRARLPRLARRAGRRSREREERGPRRLPGCRHGASEGGRCALLQREPRPPHRCGEGALSLPLPCGLPPHRPLGGCSNTRGAKSGSRAAS